MSWFAGTRALYGRMGYTDAETTLILSEIGLLEINHLVLDAGAPFASTLEPLIRRFPKYAEFVRAFDTRWVELLDGTIDSSVAILERLRGSGVPVHATSNYNREKFDIARALFPVLNAFDELVLSGDVGIVKPDAAIFELLIQRRDLDVERTGFIDDSAPNTKTFDSLSGVPDPVEQRIT